MSFTSRDRHVTSLPEELVLGLYPSSRFELLEQMGVLMAAVSRWGCNGAPVGCADVGRDLRGEMWVVVIDGGQSG